MKYIKILSIFIMIIILCGCDAVYEIEINNNKISEKLTLIEKDSTIFDKQLDSGFTVREMFDSLLYKDEFSKYDYIVTSLSNEEQLGVKYKSFGINSVRNSSVLNQCYNNYSVTEDEESIFIKTGNDFSCYEYYENLETIKIILKTNHEVINSNATLVDGNTHIWNFNKDSNKEINVTLSKVNINDTSNYIFYIIVGCLVLLICFIIYIAFNKNKKVNRI